MVISVLSLADDAYRAQFEAMVAQNASDTTHGGGNKQLVSNIQGLAEAHRVLPPGAVNCKPTIIVSGLVELVLKSYNPGSRGGTQVVYAASSLGKTTAFEAFTPRLLPDDTAALIITGTDRRQDHTQVTWQMFLESMAWRTSLFVYSKR
jgi:hypothetical protein